MFCFVVRTTHVPEVASVFGVPWISSLNFLLTSDVECFFNYHLCSADVTRPSGGLDSPHELLSRLGEFVLVPFWCFIFAIFAT